MGAPRGPRHRSRAGAKLFSSLFRAQKNVVFRIRGTQLAQKSRPSAIRGAPNSRLVSAPRPPFGTPQIVQRVAIRFCKKLPPEQGPISAQNIKNHQKSSLFEFAIERRSLRDPKTAPGGVPMSVALYRECENGRPEGPPSAQQSGREAFFLTFSRTKKRRFSHSR